MLLDIGIGILVSLALSHLFAVPLTSAFLGFGILFSLLPDIDVLFAVQKGMTAKAHEHRDVLHYPLLFIPSGMILLAFFDWHLSVLFGVVALFHFIHDSIGIGWGVQWLYPFSRDHYAFFYHYQGPREKLPRKIFYVWRHGDIKELAERYGDEQWLSNIYLKLHPYAIVELIVFIAALAILLFYR